MKRQYSIISAILFLAGLFISCSQEGENESLSGAGKEVVFNIGILQTTTRTSTTGKTTVFVSNDEIGIFGIKRGAADVLNKNLNYRYDKDGWTAESSLTFPINGDNVNFYAYYPYDKAYETTTFDFGVAEDQSVASGYNNSDLLLAKNEVAKVQDTSISLQFSHQFALVEVKAALPAGMTLAEVKLTAVKTASVNIVKQMAIVKSGEKQSVIKLMRQGDVYRAVVPAQSITGKILELITSDKTVFAYTTTGVVALPANEITTFDIDCTSGAGL